jgi:GMP synthase-like glutamine amidotransferase
MQVRPLFPFSYPDSSLFSQILAMAMGSTVAPNPAGWELGIYDVDLTPCGRDWLARVLGKGKGEEVPLLSEGEVVEKVDAGEAVRREEEVLVSSSTGLCG